MKKIAGIGLYHASLAAILCLPAIGNGYPLVYFDIGNYLQAGFRLLPDGDRFLGYGLFMRLASLGFTFWTVVFIQGLIVSLLLFQAAKKVSGGRPPYLFHFLAIVILTVTAGAGWFVSTPLPDIFTAGIILVIFLLLIERGRTLRLLTLLSALVIFEISHFSHILLALLLVAALAVVFAPRASARKYLPRLLAPFLTTGFSLLLLCSHNYLQGNGFSPSLSSSVFFVARLCDTPVLERYLEENADREELSLVRFRERLPDSYSAFLWDRESPFRLVYGWRGPTRSFHRAGSEYGKIVFEVLTTPRYLLPLLKANVRSTFRQLGRVRDMKAARIYTRETAVYRAVREFLPRDEEYFIRSRQNRGLISRAAMKRLGRIHLIVLLIALAAVVLRLAAGRIGESLALLLLVLFLGVFINAAVTGSLAMVVDRLQARVSWLIVFAGLLCVRDWLLRRPPGGRNVRR